MAKAGGLGMTIDWMRSFAVEEEKYLKGFSMWQANKGKQAAHQAQTETRALWVMVGAPRGVLADIVEADHLSVTNANSLGTWPTSIRTQWCHIVVGNSSHPSLPKGSMCLHRHLHQHSIRQLHLWCHSL